MLFGMWIYDSNQDFYFSGIKGRCVWKITEALLIIDVQNDYFPGGTNELHKR